jgi:hypothetical protein
MRRGPVVVSVVLAVLVLGPALAPGYVLSYDMVFVPQWDLTRDLVGLGDGLPRSVPVDAVVALLTTVLPGDVLQKVVLLGTLVLAGVGAGRLAAAVAPDDRAAVTGTVAAAVYVWNPYLAERLVLGHWALLVGYAVLPWLVSAAAAARGGRRRDVALVVVLLGICALTPTGGLLGGLVAGCVLLGRWRPFAVVAACWVVLDAPWWLPGLMHGGPGGTGAEAGVQLFAARSEGALGTLGTMLGLGGVWNGDVVPDSRQSAWGVLATVALLVLAGAGAPVLRRAWPGAAVRGLVLAAATGLLLALLGVLPVVRDGLATLVREVPAAGLLRDGQKWLAPWALLLALAAGAGAARAAAAVRDRALRRLVPVAAVVLVVALLPDLAWGAAGRLEAVSYPRAWARAREVVAAGPSGDVLVLPWGAFRAFGWNDSRTVLDPAGRYFPGSVVVDDTLVVGEQAVPGEGPRAAAARAALDRPDAGRRLRALGIGWVLVHRDQPGPALPVPAGRTAYRGTGLTLVRLPGPVTARSSPDGAGLVLGADALALLVLLGAGLLAVRRGEPRRDGLPIGTVPPEAGGRSTGGDS